MSAYVGLGANLGDPRAQVEAALAALAELGAVRASSLYRTEPLGPSEQPWYVNAVAELRTELAPSELLGELKALEQRAGRRSTLRWGPRILDLDLLLYGGLQLRQEGLVVPHPELGRRRFVLVPLAELAADLVEPRSGRTIGELLAALVDPLLVERLPPRASPLPPCRGSMP